MRDLVVVGFEGTHRAAHALSQVLDLNAPWAGDLHVKDAIAVYRTAGGRLRVDQTVQPTTREGAAWGGVMGALIGSLLALPFTAAAGAAIAADAMAAGALTFGAAGALGGGERAASENEQYGLSDDFVRQVGGMVQPGQSALFLVADTEKPTEVLEQFRGFGGTILRTTMPPEQAKRLQHVIDAEQPAAR
jgi:uncharacterized membrane protein